jgi:hypothetical protein
LLIASLELDVYRRVKEEKGETQRDKYNSPSLRTSAKNLCELCGSRIQGHFPKSQHETT